MSVAVGQDGHREPAASRHGPVDPAPLERPGARRAPLLPALIFTIILTQLPFVATLVHLVHELERLLPRRARLRRLRQLPPGLHRRQHPRTSVVGHHRAHRDRGAGRASSSAWASRCCSTGSSSAAAPSAR